MFSLKKRLLNEISLTSIMSTNSRIALIEGALFKDLGVQLTHLAWTLILQFVFDKFLNPKLFGRPCWYLKIITLDMT